MRKVWFHKVWFHIQYTVNLLKSVVNNVSFWGALVPPPISLTNPLPTLFFGLMGSSCFFPLQVTAVASAVGGDLRNLHTPWL